MASRTKDMTHGSPTKLILFFALPILAGNLFQQFYSLVDTLVVGRVEGVTALAAVSSAGWLDWTVLGLAMGLAQGFAIQIAQSFGAGDERELRQAAGQSIVLAAFVVVGLEITAQALLRPVLTLMNTPADTYELTCTYLRIIFGGLPFVMGFNLFAGFLRSVGNSRTPLIAMTTAALCNIALDILFVAFFRWSVVGVATATVMSQALSCTICLVAVLRLPILRLARSDFRLTRSISVRLIRLGVPVAFQNFIISVGGLVLQGVVNAQGFIFMAGYSAASRLQGLIELGGVAVGSAVGTFTGQNYGAKKMDRVRLGLRRSAQIATGLAILVAAVMIIWGKPLLQLFIEDDPAIVEQVLAFGYRFLVVMSSGLFALYLLIVYRSTLQGLGDTFIPMISGVVELFMRIGAALLLPSLLGEWGIYSAEILAWVGAAVLLIWGYYHRMHLIATGGQSL
ncbi:MAG: MATE family efflux transporter [Clostridia bacterium]|nr:MATE family efflux transporter [Clostridia bacterium]